MSATSQTKSDFIIESLLDNDDDQSLGKELTGPSEELLKNQMAELLPKIIRSKEDYLGKPFIKASEATNPKNETFLFGQFGLRNSTIVTLLYLHPQVGWIPADTAEPLREDIADDEENFKEVYGQPESKKYLPLGSISWGTMRADDVGPRLMRALKAVDPERAIQLEAEQSGIEDEEERELFVWETLFDALNDYVPPYTYFGAHEGDGSDYGVWVSNDSLDDDLRYDNPEELRAIKKGDPVVPGTGYIVVVDGAGDYTALLDGATGRELWRI